MSIYLRRKNGEITPYRNAEYIPAFYFIPKSILERCGSDLFHLPRIPHELHRNLDAIAIIESNLFIELMMDAYAYMVWPFMGFGPEMEIYSGYEPAWIFAHSPGIWIQELENEHVIPSVEMLFGSNRQYVGWMPDDLVNAALHVIVRSAMRKYKIRETEEIARQFRCFEDFDRRNSTEKIDLYRKWYHTRTRHPEVSLDALQNSYAEQYDGLILDIPDETIDVERDIHAKVDTEHFLNTLTEKDRQILLLRMGGRTLEEIAAQLGYSNHSGVLKRIRKIGQAYEHFSGTDLGFPET